MSPIPKVKGRKAWFLLSPNDPPLMVKDPWQILKTSKLQNLHVCIVEAGEVLFVPRGWWHSTWNLDNQIAVAQPKFPKVRGLTKM